MSYEGRPASPGATMAELMVSGVCGGTIVPAPGLGWKQSATGPWETPKYLPLSLIETRAGAEGVEIFTAVLGSAAVCLICFDVEDTTVQAKVISSLMLSCCLNRLYKKTAGRRKEGPNRSLAHQSFRGGICGPAGGGGQRIKKGWVIYFFYSGPICKAKTKKKIN